MLTGIRACRMSGGKWIKVAAVLCWAIILKPSTSGLARAEPGLWFQNRLSLEYEMLGFSLQRLFFWGFFCSLSFFLTLSSSVGSGWKWKIINDVWSYCCRSTPSMCRWFSCKTVACSIAAAWCCPICIAQDDFYWDVYRFKYSSSSRGTRKWRGEENEE